MIMTQETVDAEQYAGEYGYRLQAERMVGKMFNHVLASLESKGYVAGRRIANRAENTTTVTITKGSHEVRSMFKVTFSWDPGSCGISVPGKIVACSWIRPLKVAPNEVR